MKHETRPTPETDAEESKHGDGNAMHAHCHDSSHLSCDFADFARKLERERDELREAIAEFCKEHDWACDEWKRQPHIARLFNLNKKP